MYTQAQIENREGCFRSEHTCIYQRGNDDAFQTGDAHTIPATGFHLAGGAAPGQHVQWCDLRTK